MNKTRDIVVKWQRLGKSSEFVLADETDKYMFNCGMPVEIPKEITKQWATLYDRVVFVRYADENN